MKGRIEIDRNLCKGCRYCIIACPKNLISIDNTFNSNGFFPAVILSMEGCTGCAHCAQMCPDLAITVWKEEQGDRTEQ